METKVKCHGNPIQELLSPWRLVKGEFEEGWEWGIVVGRMGHNK